MRRSWGFSLLEILVVMAIIALMAAFVVPATSTMVRGTKLSQASQVMVEQLSLARQMAISLNRPVEVRFYCYADEEIPGEQAAVSTSWRFRAIQAFEVQTAVQILPLGKLQALPAAVVIDSGSSLSSLLDQARRTLRAGVDPIPRANKNYKYYAVRFRPDRSTDLSPTEGPWFITLHDQVNGDALRKPPANFATIEIDPINGALKFFRPGM